MARRYVIPLLSGFAMFVTVYLIDGALASVGMHAETTYLDDVLLGILTSSLTFLIQREHERELRRQRQSAVMIEQMNHHLRNALQVIVYHAHLQTHDARELEELRKAVNRIDWALKEILPFVAGNQNIEKKPWRLH